MSREEFDSWIFADKYSKKQIKKAIIVKKHFRYKRRSILTFNIDKVLEEKGLSRTNLSKQINMPKSVMEKVSNVLEISQCDILSWIIADKYSLILLEKVYI